MAILPNYKVLSRKRVSRLESGLNGAGEIFGISLAFLPCDKRALRIAEYFAFGRHFSKVSFALVTAVPR